MTYVLPRWCETWPDEERKKAEKAIYEANKAEKEKREKLMKMLDSLIQPEPAEDECC